MAMVLKLRGERRSVGRPRRLSIERIVVAARNIGLDNLDMVRIAEELGVGVATLYGYVDSREELARLVATSELEGTVVRDCGQGWRDAVRAHSATVFVLYTAQPRLLAMLMNGSIGPDAEAQYLNALLAILTSRGLSPEQAIAVYGEATMLVIGASVGSVYQRAVDEPRGAFASALHQTLGESGEGELVALRLCADARIGMSSLCDYAPALERLLADPRWPPNPTDQDAQT